MEFPRQQTGDDRYHFLTRKYNDILNENDALREEIERLNSQLRKYIGGGGDLTKRCESMHWDIVALREGIRIRDEKIEALKSKCIESERGRADAYLRLGEARNKIKEIQHMGEDLKRRLNTSAVSVSPMEPPRPKAPWPAVGNIVQVMKAQPPSFVGYYEVLAIGASPPTTYTWPGGSTTPLFPGQYLVLLSEARKKKENELVDGVDWDILYIGEWSATKKDSEDRPISKFGNYISNEKPLE